ncbi:MAG: UbiX family flavin prenyltransferase [Gammaproteobacteria bacterium]|nr:UbiX family flavin prenyltransferase [Gammaproteobacteria bacterium]
MKKLIVGISGASGAVYGIRLLEVLRDTKDIQTLLVISNTAKQTIRLETNWSINHVEALADEVYAFSDVAACISSGSHKTMGMIIAPCSIRTLSGIAHSYSDNLLLRAADVTLKDRRRLLLLLRETPLHLGHARLIVGATEAGAVVMPPVPAFYHRPKTIDDIVNQTVNRVLDQFDIELEHDLFERWQGARARRRDKE